MDHIGKALPSDLLSRRLPDGSVLTPSTIASSADHVVVANRQLPFQLAGLTTPPSTTTHLSIPASR
jgi:hypothetical protein